MIQHPSLLIAGAADCQHPYQYEIFHLVSYLQIEVDIYQIYFFFYNFFLITIFQLITTLMQDKLTREHAKVRSKNLQYSEYNEKGKMMGSGSDEKRGKNWG